MNMIEDLRYPYQLENAFFIVVNIQRAPEISPTNFEFNAMIKVIDKDFPDTIQVNPNIKTIENKPLIFNMELVGIFKLIPDQPKPDKSILKEFIYQQAIYMLWPYISSMVRQLTSQMGMVPINIPTPYKFELSLDTNIKEKTEI